MEHERPLHAVPDDELLRRLADLLRKSRRSEADMVAHIGEVDERKLFAREAAPSMFAYCTEVLHLSEAEAYLRITTARAAREHPVLLTMLGDGRLHLRGIVMLAPHLSPENRDGLLARATHKSKRQIEELIAEIAPRPDAPTTVRKLPERRSLAVPGPSPGLDLGTEPAGELCPGRVPPVPLPDLGQATLPVTLPAPVPPTIVQPLSLNRYRVQFTASAALRDKLERLQALMRSDMPDGDLALVIEQAVTEKLERLEARRNARTDAPRKDLTATDTSSSSRHIPAAVRRVVSERDGNRCRYTDEKGRRCGVLHRLEYHHRRPYGFGGGQRPENISLLCPTHNQYLAERDYGRQAMTRHRGGTVQLG